MINRLSIYLNARSVLFNNIFKLAISTALGQIIFVAASPVITRLYSPNDFGVLAIYSAFLAVIATTTSLSFEITIPLADTDVDAANIVFLCNFLAIFSTILLTVLIYFEAFNITTLTKTTQILPYVYLLPLGLLISNIYSTYNYWLTRRKNFSPIASTRIMQGVSNVVLSVLFGCLGLKPVGLLLAQIAGQSAGVTNLVKHSLKKDLLGLKSEIKFSKIMFLAKKYKKFALFVTPSGIVNNLGLVIAPILFSSLYGVGLAGIIAFGDRVALTPMKIIGSSVNQVFYSEMAQRRRENQRLDDLFFNTSIKLFTLGLIPCIIVAIFAPLVCNYIFSEKWNDLGVYLRFMAIPALIQFVANPVQTVFGVLERPDLEFLWNIIRLTIIVIAIYIGKIYFNNSVTAIAIYACAVLISYVISYLMCVYLIRKK
jgi:O-antigen/teichoic acid export membrane protein